jgi:acetyl-CoA acyltransferase
VAIVAGLRTPFARAGGALKDVTAIELGKACVAELIQRADLDGREVDALVFGTVVQAVTAPNIAREVSLLPMLPRGVQSFTVSRACASANQAITDAADQIALGHASCIIAGGAESLSQVPILHSRGMSDVLVAASKAKSLPQRLQTLARIRPRDLVPVTPAIAEPSTGETMGQSAEKMAKLNGISREAQDGFALRSHRLAAAGTRDGRMAAEIAPFYPTGPRARAAETTGPRARAAEGVSDTNTVITADDGIRENTSYEQLAALRPVFDKRYGSVTAGNASPLTDGAAAVILMSEERAKALGHTPLGYVRSYAYAALDPGEQLLQAPVLAAPVALQRAGLTLADIDLVEMHEAFASQVLSNLQGFASQAWAERAGFSQPVGEVDPEKLNAMGGSIAIGHPFGATGARVLTTLLLELGRRGGQFGMLSVCAAGGMGHVMVVERE